MIPALLASWCTQSGAAPEPKAAQLPPVALENLDLQRGWFKPMPARDADPICGTLASDARRYFRSAGEWSQYAAADLAEGTGLVRVARPSADASPAVAELRALPDEPEQLILDRPSQPRLFLYFETQPAGQRLALSDQRITRGEPGVPVTAQTPEADAWTLYRAASGTWYAAGIVEQHLQLYALTTPQQWRLSCDMALAPYRLRQSLDPAARTALTAVDALHSAAQPLGAGDCGASFSVRALEQTLYRPWQWLGQQRRESYRGLLTSIDEWAANDPDRRAALDRYTIQLASSIEAVQRFYMQKFGWNTQVATRVAYDALTAAIGSGLGSSAPAAQCAQEAGGF